jgi:predicted dehydrogenase
MQKPNGSSTHRRGRDSNGKSPGPNGKGRRRIRYAVVGLGNIAQVAVLPAFEHARGSSELVALVSSDKTKLRELSKRYDISLTGSYDDLEDVIREGHVDAVYLAVPNHLHRKFTERAAKAGAHVLCEKPMALSTKDCEAMIRVTRKYRKKLMIAYRLHFEEGNLDAIEKLQKGQIGEPRIMSSVFCHQVRPGDIRARAETGGGALYDMGIYCVNAARFLFRAEPEEVSAEQFVGTSRRFRDVDEMTTALLRFPGDRVAQFTAGQGAADVGEYRVVGTKGDLRLDPAYEYHGALEQFVTVEGKTRHRTFPKRDQFAPELIHFSQCILENRTPEPSGEEGLADVRVLEALMRSARSGKKITLPPFSRRTRPSRRLAMKRPAVGKVSTVRAPSPSE